MKNEFSIFTTWEVTKDIASDSLSILLDIEKNFNEQKLEISSSRLRRVGIVLVIMNPNLIEPFPSGRIFREKEKELDCKILIDANLWSQADKGARLTVAFNAIDNIFVANLTSIISDEDIALLRRGLQYSFNKTAATNS